MPLRLDAVLTRAASHVDAGVRYAMFHPSARSAEDRQAEALGHAARMEVLDEVGALYDRPQHFAEPSTFFPAPAAIRPELRRVRSIARTRERPDGGEVLDAGWASGFAPHCTTTAEAYLAHTVNGRAAARLYLHGGAPRPAVILLHGYKCGHFALEERVWPVDWLFARGLDVALAVLPFHAVRASRGCPSFPASDPRTTVEGFRQAIHDVRGLARWLRARGASAVGVMGMSLGGYTTALLATIEDELDFAVPLIPLASLPEVVRGIGRFVGTPDEQRLQFEAFERALKVVSPLARPPRLPAAAERMMVVAASGDRITPVDHARWIANHFQAPLSELAGGHLLQLWRREAFRMVGRMLERLGLFERRAAVLPEL